MVSGNKRFLDDQSTPVSSRLTTQRGETHNWIIEERQDRGGTIRGCIRGIRSEDVTSTHRFWGVQALLRLLLFIVLINFRDQLLQQHLYSSKSLSNLVATGSIMLLRILLAETGSSPLWKVEIRNTPKLRIEEVIQQGTLHRR